MSKPISPKQAQTLCRLFGLTEAQIRQHLGTHEKASPVIGAAKGSDTAALFAACAAAGLPSAWTENLAEKHAAYRSGKPAEPKAEPDPAPVPDPDPKDDPAPDPADPEGFRAHITEAIAQIMGVADMLADKVQARVSSALEGIVQAGDAAIASARAEGKGDGGSSLPPLPPPTEGYIRPGWYGKLASAARGGLDVVLTGPAGTGKSRAARELAKDLGRESLVFACRAGMTASQLFYSKGLEGGSDVWRILPLLEAVQRPSVVCLDEAFSIDPECLNGLNGLLESSQRSIDTPLGTITRHPENVIILTANGDGRSNPVQYRAVQAQDASTLSRCAAIRVDYSKDVELGMAQAHLGADKGKLVAQLVQDMRAALQRAQIEYDVTPRVFSQIAGWMRGGLSFSEACQDVLLAKLAPSERAKIESSLTFPA